MEEEEEEDYRWEDSLQTDHKDIQNFWSTFAREGKQENNLHCYYFLAKHLLLSTQVIKTKLSCHNQ